MLDIGYFHPLVIHFAIGVTLIGILLRELSLSGRFPFTGPAATTLILLGVVAVIVAAWSGEDAHIAVEAIPGIDAAVHAHQTWGERTRNLVLLLVSVEVLALVLASRGRARPDLLASGVIGLVSAVCIMQTGKLGGELVYAHAGGVGIRSSDPEDVRRLLLAGLYQQAQVDEHAGRSADTATLIELAAQRFPSDDALQLVAAESLLQDRRDPLAALAVLSKVETPATERRLRLRCAWLMADAYQSLGQTDAVRVTLQKLQSEFQDSERVRKRLAQSSANVPTPSLIRHNAS